MSFKPVGQDNIFLNQRDLRFAGVSVQATAIGEYNQQIPLDVAKAALKDDGLDQIIFEAEGKTYVAYADGLNFEGLKKGGAPASIFEGNLPMTVTGRFAGKDTDVRILHIDNEANTYTEGAKKLALVTAATQAVPNAVQVGLAPAAGRAAANGTNLMAKVTRWAGSAVTQLGQKTGLGTLGVAVAAGVISMGVGVGGGAIYYGHMRGEDYKPVNGLLVKP